MVRLGIDPPRCCAMVQYDNADSAKDALNSLKGSFIGNSKRLMVRFIFCIYTCTCIDVSFFDLWFHHYF